jgi:hypothetical protein
MKVNMIDKQVKNSNDPFIVFKVTLLNSDEEIKDLTSKVEEVLTLDEVTTMSQVTSADIDIRTSYMIIRHSNISQFEYITNKCGFKIKMVEFINNVWEFNNEEFQSFVSLFESEDEDPCPELTEFAFGPNGNVLDILEAISESKFTIDNVLDKISTKGIESLNDLNKYILEKESR